MSPYKLRLYHNPRRYSRILSISNHLIVLYSVILQ
uniref:Uncharacterized protein n=1 Tax=Staphylococcus phage 184DA TaxID=3110532 RepID=A0AAU6MX86_9CAUD